MIQEHNANGVVYGHEPLVVKTEKSFEEFLNDLESSTGLKFHASIPSGDSIHGAITQYGNDAFVIVYRVDKEPNVDSPHYFKAVDLTDELIRKINLAG